MKLDQFLIALVIFGVIILAGVFTVGNLEDNYNVSMSDDKLGNISSQATTILASTYNISQGQKDQVMGGEVSTEDSWSSMIKGGYSALRLITGSFSLVGNTIYAIASALNVPTFFITALLTILTIAIIFSIIYIVFRAG